MFAFEVAGSAALTVTNLLLGIACVAMLVAVVVALALDVRERRRWRAMVPPGWPPPGVDPDEADGAPLRRTNRRRLAKKPDGVPPRHGA